MNSSDTINELAAALAKAQGEIKNPIKGSENPHFKSRYADLADGLDAIRPVLSKHSLSVVQVTSMTDDVMMLHTRLIHSSGQWIGSVYPVCKFPIKHQEAGSALTYARRYALFAMAGVAGDDDDGNEASKTQTPAPRSPARPVTLTPPESEDERNKMLDMLDRCESRESLHAWATANSTKKAQLLPDHQVQVTKAFKDREQAIRNPAPVAAE